MLAEGEKSKPSKQRGKRTLKIQRGNGNEAKRVSQRLKGFDHIESEAYKALTYYYSSGVTHNELKSLAQVICMHSNLKLDRDATRDNRVLIKWFQENWEIVKTMLPRLHLKDTNHNIIDSSREKTAC